MKYRDLLTRKNVAIASAVLIIVLGVAAYFALRRPPRAPMEKYVPASALAFIEIENLSDLVDGITGTRAWREIAPALGLSSQLRQIGFVADLVGRTGVGPDEAVLAGRAQYALALTGIESETGATDEGPYVHFKLKFALIVETHSDATTAARMVKERASILAQRIYGESAKEEAEDYLGAQLMIFRGPQPERMLVAAASGTAIVVSNNTEAIKSCLDAINNRSATMAENVTLRERRNEVDGDAPVFAFVSQTGIETISKIGPAIFASRITNDPDSINATANLFGHMSKQAAEGFLYSSRFASGGVMEKYVTVLRPEVAESLAAPLKPAAGAGFESLKLVPNAIEDLTILNIEEPSEMPERVLKQLSPRVDVVAGIALREFVLNFQKQLGLEPEDETGKFIGDEVALIRFLDGGPMAVLARVKDRAGIFPVIERYLKKDAATVSTAQYRGTEIAVSSHEDGRAAAFAGDFLVLGTRDQIARIVDAQLGGNAIANDERFEQVFKTRPATASIISYRPEVKDVGEMMLAIARLTRVSDGSRELLQRDPLRSALNRVLPSVSFTEFRDYGIYTETRSAIGNYSLIASLFEEEQK